MKLTDTQKTTLYILLTVMISIPIGFHIGYETREDIAKTQLLDQERLSREDGANLICERLEPQDIKYFGERNPCIN